MENNVNQTSAGSLRAQKNENRTPSIDELMRENETAMKVVSSEAENNIASIAGIIKVIGGVLAVIIVIAGFYIASESSSGSSKDSNGLPIIISIVVALLVYLPIYLRWAILKIYINISRNLFVIKGILLHQAKTTNSQESSKASMQQADSSPVEEKKENDDKIAKLKELRDAGIISQDEFENQMSIQKI